jgi:hypothetical protein
LFSLWLLPGGHRFGFDVHAGHLYVIRG